MTHDQEQPTVTAVANWYGSNRMLASRAAALLDGCTWVGIPYAGGMCELLHLKARTLGVNDLHRHVINLARVMADPIKAPILYRRLRRKVFHPDELQEAQRYCAGIDQCEGDSDALFASGYSDPRFEPTDVDWAEKYFVSSWMTRGGGSGTKNEFAGGLPLRWDSDGGASAKRFHSAVESIPAWRRVLKRCEFSAIDAMEFLDNCKDKAGIGVYCDPPFPGPGDKYRHRMSDSDQRRLAKAVSGFKSSRVVMRFYDHPFIRELYPDTRWRWIEHQGRTQTNGEAPEVLLVNGGSHE